MATLYLDFENGNDNYGGSSFSLLASGTDGRISSTTFSASGASFPNDGSLIGQYLSIFNGTIYAVYNITAWVSSTSLTIAAISGGTALANQAVDRQYYIGGRWKNITTGATAVRTVPGDTIRIMGSPAPTSLGQNGVWTSQALQATKSITGATNATPISITCTAHGYSTGDTVVITGVGGNTNANGTWEITSTGANTFTLDGSAGNANYTSGGTARLRNNTRVKLASAVTQNIASTGPRATTWTPSANVTTLFSPLVKEHRDGDRINIDATFTTGLAAYWQTGTLDLSAYQQVSFWIYQTGGSPRNSGDLDLRLCSDAAGTTAVNIIPIPGLRTLSKWMPVTVDLGVPLGSNIQSIGLYLNVDLPAQEFIFSNIIACKASSAADSLTLTSLIGKNTTGETFWGIQSINGRRVMLDADTNAGPASTTVRGYYGTSETVTTWKRETIKLGPAASSNTALQTIQDSGTDGSPITFSGGWDRTNMSTQNLETWLDGVNGNGFGISNSRTWTELRNLSFARFYSGLNYGSNSDLNVCQAGAINNSTLNGIDFASSAKNLYLEIDHIAAAANSGLQKAAVATANIVIKLNRGIISCANNGLDFQLGRADLLGVSNQAIIANNASPGISHSGTALVAKNVKTENNGTAGISTAQGADIYLSNCEINEGTEINISAFSAFAAYSHNHDNTSGNHKIFGDGYLISAATDQRKTASGISWKIQPANSTRIGSLRPVTLSLAKVACAANSLVTVKAWMRRDNTGLTMRLVCKGGQIAGVSSDVVSAMTAAADTWAEQSITFTPTETGVVEITAEAWGGTTFSGWVDDLTISQA